MTKQLKANVFGTMMTLAQFKERMAREVEEETSRMERQAARVLQMFSEITFEKFSNKSPYKGEVENKFFFTYSDHYSGNTGAFMYAGSLHHPHTKPDDRGYIKGVATDLKGYRTLLTAHQIGHQIGHFAKDFKLKGEFLKCFEEAKKKLDAEEAWHKDTMNKRLKQMTGCSLLSYMDGCIYQSFCHII